MEVLITWLWVAWEHATYPAWGWCWAMELSSFLCYLSLFSIPSCLSIILYWCLLIHFNDYIWDLEPRWFPLYFPSISYELWLNIRKITCFACIYELICKDDVLDRLLYRMWYCNRMYFGSHCCNCRCYNSSKEP